MTELLHKYEPRDLLDIRHVETIDVSRIRPVLKCVDFQAIAPSQLKNEFTLDGLTFRGEGASVKVSVIDMPAPAHAHDWIPDPIHYLEASSFSTTYLTIEFPEPAVWVELSAAPGKTNVMAPSSSVTVAFENSEQHQGASVDTLVGSFSIRTLTYNAASVVRIGGGEFEPPATFEPCGDVKRLIMYGNAADIVVWQVCWTA